MTRHKFGLKTCAKFQEEKMNDRSRQLRLRAEGDDPGRLLALSDGLFATVLTILVLDLTLPDISQLASAGDVHRVINELGVHLFSYVLTFVVAGVSWLAHHGDFNHIIRYNYRLLWYNLMFLLFVGLLPFSTAAISNNNLSAVSWSIYALNNVAIGVMLSLTWGYAYTHRLTNLALPRRAARYQGLRHLITPGMFLISIGIVYLTPNTYLAPYSLLMIPVIMVFLDRRVLGKDTEPSFDEPRGAALFWRLASFIPVIVLIALAVVAFTVTQPSVHFNLGADDRPFATVHRSADS